LIFLRNGEASDYHGPREGPGIAQWVAKKSGPPSAEVDCATMVDQVSKEKLNLSYFGELSGDLYDAFIGAA